MPEKAVKSYWRQLKRILLLGANRSRPNEELYQAMARRGVDPELPADAWLLQALATEAAFRKGAPALEKHTAPIPPPFEGAERLATVTVGKLLEVALEEDYETLLEDVDFLFGQHQLHWPPERYIDLLESAGEDPRGLALFIRHAGPRGIWYLQQTEKWKKYASKQAAWSYWQRARPKERTIFLQILLKGQSPVVEDLLYQVFAAYPLKDPELVQDLFPLLIQATPKVAPSLLTDLRDRATAAPDKRRISQLLCTIDPEGEPVLQVRQLLTTYFTTRGKLIDPAPYDAAAMRPLGLDEAGLPPHQIPIELTAWHAPDFWLEYWNVEPMQAVEYFLELPRGLEFVTSLIQAIRQVKDPEKAAPWWSALLTVADTNPHYALWPMIKACPLPPKTMEAVAALIFRMTDDRIPALFWNWLSMGRGPFTVQLSQQLDEKFQARQAFFSGSTLTKGKLVKQLPLRAHPSIMKAQPWLEDFLHEWSFGKNKEILYLRKRLYESIDDLK